MFRLRIISFALLYRCEFQPGCILQFYVSFSSLHVFGHMNRYIYRTSRLCVLTTDPKFFLYDKKKPFPRRTIRVTQNFPKRSKTDRSPEMRRQNSSRRIGAVRCKISIYLYDFFRLYFCMSCLRPRYYHTYKTISNVDRVLAGVLRAERS